MYNNLKSEGQYSVRKEAAPMTLIKRLPRNGKKCLLEEEIKQVPC